MERKGRGEEGRGGEGRGEEGRGGEGRGESKFTMVYLQKGQR